MSMRQLSLIWDQIPGPCSPCLYCSNSVQISKNLQFSTEHVPFPSLPQKIHNTMTHTLYSNWKSIRIFFNNKVKCTRIYRCHVQIITFCTANSVFSNFTTNKWDQLIFLSLPVAVTPLIKLQKQLFLWKICNCLHYSYLDVVQIDFLITFMFK